MSTLYEINREIVEVIANAVDPETGEITGDLSSLETLEMARDEKIENTGLYIKNLAADIEQLKNEENALKQRRQIKEHRIDRLKQYVSYSLQNAGHKKFETPRLSLSFRKTTAVDIDDMDKLPEEYRRTKTEIRADKTAISKAIKNGVEVDGARLVERLSLQIK